MIRVSCPKCKATLQVEDKHAGQVIACSNCQTSLQLPPAPPPPPAPPIASSPVSTPKAPEETASPAAPVARDETKEAQGTAEASFQEKAKAVAAQLISAWQGATTPIKAAVIGGTSVMFLSCFLCCGCVGFRSFLPSNDNSKLAKSKSKSQRSDSDSFIMDDDDDDPDMSQDKPNKKTSADKGKGNSGSSAYKQGYQLGFDATNALVELSRNTKSPLDKKKLTRQAEEFQRTCAMIQGVTKGSQDEQDMVRGYYDGMKAALK